MLSHRKQWYALVAGYMLLFIALVLGIAACSKKADLDSKDLPELAGLTHAYITTQETVIRTGPGLHFNPIARVAPDAKVDVVGRDGSWLLVVSKKGNAPGYIDAGMVRPDNGNWEPAPVAVQGPYRIVADTQVRKGPGPHYEAVAAIPKGIKINVIGMEEDWLKVKSKHGKPAGYVHSNYAQPIAAN